MTFPPAEAIIALTHTVMDSARWPWTPIAVPWALAAAMTCSHVTGLVMSRPAAWATALAVPEQLRVGPERRRDELVLPGGTLHGPVDDAVDHCCCRSAGTFARNPASDVSGTNTGSRLMRSIEESLPARRRMSCSRWAAASLGRIDV